MGANDPQGGAIFDPRDVIDRIYVKLHITTLHTTYRSFGSWGSQRSWGFCFPTVRLPLKVISILLFADGKTNFAWMSNVEV